MTQATGLPSAPLKVATKPVLAVLFTYIALIYLYKSGRGGVLMLVGNLSGISINFVLMNPLAHDDAHDELIAINTDASSNLKDRKSALSVASLIK